MHFVSSGSDQNDMGADNKLQFCSLLCLFLWLWLLAAVVVVVGHCRCCVVSIVFTVSHLQSSLLLLVLLLSIIRIAATNQCWMLCGSHSHCCASHWLFDPLSWCLFCSFLSTIHTAVLGLQAGTVIAQWRWVLGGLFSCVWSSWGMSCRLNKKAIEGQLWKTQDICMQCQHHWARFLLERDDWDSDP